MATVRNSNGDVIDGFKGSGAYKYVVDTITSDNLEATEIPSKSSFKTLSLKDEM
ncbi:MAG: hypothetical protein L3J67_03915 [Hyphomicrobiaceae bacterium]|nr:hypothetical protein [Hyphomicrobiaceae bacterium]